MKAKKLLSSVIALATLLSQITTFAADNDTVTVYAASQSYGAFMTAPQQIEVSASEAEKYGYTDMVSSGVSALDVLVKEHELIFGGDFTADTKNEYLSLSGTSVAKIFGVETYSNGFLLNGGYPNDGTESTYGGYNGTTVSTQEVKDGDKLDFFIYQDESYYSDKYTWLDTSVSGKNVEITAKGAMVMYGYTCKTPDDFKASAAALCGTGLAWVDENGGLTPIDGVVTDDDGKAQITLPDYDVHYITAVGTDDSDSPVIMNSVIVKAEDEPASSEPIPSEPIPSEPIPSEPIPSEPIPSEPIPSEPIPSEPIPSEPAEISALDVCHAIAQRYAKSGIANDQNAAWFALDMSAYKKFGNTSLSEKQITEFLDKLIANAEKTTYASELAKSIIALRALGFNPSDVTTAQRNKIDIAKKLGDLIASGDSGATNIYTLPYVIIAADGCGIDTTDLISLAIKNKSDWQNMSYGSDAACPMICALAPYYDKNDDVKAVVDDSLPLIADALKTNSFSKNAASVGLAITAFSAVLPYSDEVETKYVKDIMNYVASSHDGFEPTSNSFSTEQGFRGLVAWQLAKQYGLRLFDFSANENNPVSATWAQHCPVTFDIIPSDANITIENQTAVFANTFDLPCGEYSYTASKSGYSDKNGTVTVTEEDALSHTPKTVKLSLVSNPSGGGSSKVSVNIRVMTHDKCDNSYTYKNNSSSYKALAKGTVTLIPGQTVFDALDKLLKDNNISYTEKTYGYISKIGDYAEFDHGSNSGWMFMVGTKVSENGCRDVKISKSCDVTWFFTDDYTREYGSEKWSGGGSGSGVSGKYTVKFVSSGTVSGKVSVSKGASVSEPKEPVKNGYTFGGWYLDEKFEKKYDFSEKVTSDITLYAKWISNDSTDEVQYAYDNKYILGTENGFEPDLAMTRAMVCQILYRVEGMPEVSGTVFDDVQSGAWYESAVAWANQNKIVNGTSDKTFAPDASVTLEQLAAMLYRYAGFKGHVFESGNASLENIAPYAREAVSALYSLGILSTDSNKEISRLEGVTSIVKTVKIIK